MKKISYYKLKIDSELWKAFKIKCATEGKSMLEVIIYYIKKYVGVK
jgi:hypothetical protein